MLRGCMVRIIPIDELSANSGCSPDRLYPAPETLHYAHQFLSDPACVQSTRQTNMEMERRLQEIIPHAPPRVCRRRPQGRLTAMHKVIGTLNAQRKATASCPRPLPSIRPSACFAITIFTVFSPGQLTMIRS